MWLPWNDAAVLAVLVAAIAWFARGWLRATAHELALVLSLYSVWRLAGATTQPPVVSETACTPDPVRRAAREARADRER